MSTTAHMLSLGNYFSTQRPWIMSALLQEHETSDGSDCCFIHKNPYHLPSLNRIPQRYKYSSGPLLKQSTQQTHQHSCTHL